MKKETLYRQKFQLQNVMDTDFDLKDDLNPKLRILCKNETCISLKFKILAKYLENRKLGLTFDFNINFEGVQLKLKKPYNQEYFYNTSIETILRGGIKGLIMLQETYMQDIKHYYQGNLQLENKIQYRSRKVHSLLPQDLAAMSSIAITVMKWYDNSLQYLKAALDLFYSFSINDRSQLPLRQEKSLLEMKIDYSKLHNDLLGEKQNNLGSDWKLYPDMVDKG